MPAASPSSRDALGLFEPKYILRQQPISDRDSRLGPLRLLLLLAISCLPNAGGVLPQACAAAPAISVSKRASQLCSRAT